MFKKLILAILVMFSVNSSFAIDRYTVSYLVKQLAPAVVTVSHKNNEQKVGSGVIVSSDGYVVTNYHVVQGTDSLNVKFQDNSHYSANLINYDSRSDLAILKIKDYNAFPFVYFGNSSNVEVGELVFAIGSPYGLENSVSMGIISGKNRHMGIAGYDEFLQTDASINPGNSGGPLFNLDGKLIGINTAALMPNGSATGIGFAIPSNTVERIIKDLKQGKNVQRASLGVEFADINYSVKQQLNLNSLDGAVVYNTNNHGFWVGDVITKYNGIIIKRASDLQKQLSQARVGDKIYIEIIRQNKKYKIKAELGQK